MRPSVVLPTGCFLDGYIADAVIAAHEKGDRAVKVMDERAGDGGVILEILGSFLDDDGRRVIRVAPLGEAG